MRIKRFALAAIAFTALPLTILGIISEYPLISAFALLFGLVWGLLFFFEKHFANTLAFIGYIFIVMISAFVELNFAILLAVVCFDLAAWNLTKFWNRIQRYELIENQQQLENHHLKQVFGVLITGYILAIIPHWIEIELSFFLIFLLSLLTFFLFGKGITALHKEK